MKEAVSLSSLAASCSDFATFCLGFFPFFEKLFYRNGALRYKMGITEDY